VKVISASRRVDLVAGYPEFLIKTLSSKCPPDQVHTIVIWTKNATNIFVNSALNSLLLQYDQIYLHYSITGMGNSQLEPNIPPIDETISLLPALIEFTGNVERIRIRFDPIVHLILPNGEHFTNINYFEPIAAHASSLGIQNISISWMQLYDKVRSRLTKTNIQARQLTSKEIVSEAKQMQKISEQYKIKLHGCCVPELPISRCIDGDTLNQLHPKNFICSTKRAKGQRTLCGCTESWDIGWYRSCVGGCIYCYANPAKTDPSARR